MSWSGFVRVAVLALAGGLAACDAGGFAGPTPIASLSIASADTVLAVGETAAFQAVARNAVGKLVGGAEVVWRTSDTLVAVVDSTGRVSGVAPGVTRLSASSGGVADSVQLRVRTAGLTLGRMVGRLRTAAGDAGLAWGGSAQFQDVLGTDEGEMSLLAGTNESLTEERDSTLVLYLPGRIGAGARPITAFPLTGIVPRTVPTALLVIRSASIEELWSSVDGGSLRLEAVQFPPRAGLDAGAVHGVVGLRLVRLAPGGVGGPVPTADTLDFHADFVLHLEHRLLPNVTLALAGAGPVVGTSVRSTAQTAQDGRGGLLVWWDADFDGLPGQGWPFEASQEFRLGAPAPGTHAVAAMTPAVYASPAAWSRAFSSLGYRDESRLGFSTGGTLEVSRYVAPTDAYYGEIHGTLASELELWADDDTSTGERVQATASFAVQIWPLAGVPAAVPAAEDHIAAAAEAARRFGLRAPVEPAAARATSLATRRR